MTEIRLTKYTWFFSYSRICKCTGCILVVYGLVSKFPYISKIQFPYIEISVYYKNTVFRILVIYGFAEYTGLNSPVYEVFRIFSVYLKYTEPRTLPYSHTFFAVQYNTIQCNAMQCNAIQYNTMQWSAIKCNEVQCSVVIYICNVM